MDFPHTNLGRASNDSITENLLSVWGFELQVRHMRLVTIINYKSTANPAPAHRAPPPHLKMFKSIFLKIFTAYPYKLYCKQHAMFTKRILFSALTSKTNGICEGTSKQSPDLKNYTAPGLRRDRVPRFLNSWIRHCKLLWPESYRHAAILKYFKQW